MITPPTSELGRASTLEDIQVQITFKLDSISKLEESTANIYNLYDLTLTDLRNNRSNLSQPSIQALESQCSILLDCFNRNDLALASERQALRDLQASLLNVQRPPSPTPIAPRAPAADEVQGRKTVVWEAQNNIWKESMLLEEGKRELTRRFEDEELAEEWLAISRCREKVRRNWLGRVLVGRAWFYYFVD